MQLPFAKDKLQEALNVRVIGEEHAQLTVVLAHGFGCTQSLWDHVLPSLLNHTFRGGLRTILFDWPGAASTTFDFTPPSLFYHGFAQILISLLQELNVSSCTYVGHSMSAMIGCIAALRQPSLFRKLILVAASPRYLNGDGYYGGFEQEELNYLYEAMATDFHGWASGFAGAVVGIDGAESVVQKFKTTLSGMRPETALAMAKAIFQNDFRWVIEDLARNANAAADGRVDDGGSCGGMQVSVLQTRKDVAVPLVVSDYLKLSLGSKGRVEILQTDGHLPQLSAPQLFNAALLRTILE